MVRCIWKQKGYYYLVGCNNKWIEDQNENNFVFCPFCGSKIKMIEMTKQTIEYLDSLSADEANEALQLLKHLKQCCKNADEIVKNW